ncbi:Hint domain-containing protein [Loktanella sp. IMCC34160]|uniref:Hint domain-containing protein n=1 Tax=Loktanella sp. IMCC34160 TaxID=2510646 RepID=UPI00101BE63A|nr:Hint domain-containing protein [Loktanella sp. IMCC34160]RYG92760.1 Hint domain-containing protein [Loktanella sp. IMCC34160]
MQHPATWDNSHSRPPISTIERLGPYKLGVLFKQNERQMAIISNTGQLLYAGNFAEFDTDESNNAAENYDGLIGTVISDPSAVIDSFVLEDVDNNGSISETGSIDTVTVGGVTSAIDTFMVVSLLVTNLDGTTFTTLVVAFQLDNGDVYITDLVDRIEGTYRSIEIIDVGDTGGGSGISGWQPGGSYYISNLELTPCFAKGTQIETQSGPIPIEALRKGCLIPTLDHGLQALRWVGFTRRIALADGAPVLFPRGSVGNTRDLLVSPQHRMLLASPMAELMFGANEVLCPAKAMVGVNQIRRKLMPTVDYYHLLFDQHEIIWANGTPSESFLPGSPAALAFPELIPNAAPMVTARLSLTARETSVLLREMDTLATPYRGPLSLVDL